MVKKSTEKPSSSIFCSESSLELLRCEGILYFLDFFFNVNQNDIKKMKLLPKYDSSYAIVYYASVISM